MRVRDFLGERGRLDRIRRRLADGIVQPKLAHLPGESVSISPMIGDPRPNHWRLSGERGRLDRIRRRLADGIVQPKLAHLPGDSAIISPMMGDPRIRFG